MSTSCVLAAGAITLGRKSAVRSLTKLFDPAGTLRRYQRTTLSGSDADRAQKERETGFEPQMNAAGLLLYFFLAFLERAGSIGPFTPTWSLESLLSCLFVHAAIVEPLCYITHVIMHLPSLYAKQHFYHHKSVLPTPLTSVTSHHIEQAAYNLLFVLPIVLPSIYGRGSWAQMIMYAPLLELCKGLGHTNLELSSPVRDACSPWFYTSAYHQVHHQLRRKNFALFMPIYDRICGTMERHATEKLRDDAYRKQDAERPAYVFYDNVSSARYGLTTNDDGLGTVWRVALWAASPAAGLLPDAYWNLLSRRTRCSNTAGLVRILPILAFQHKRCQRFCIRTLKRAIAQQKQQHPQARVVGLGGLSDAGQALVPLADQLGLSLCTGNAMTAAVVAAYAKKMVPPGEHIYLTGATSPVGRAVCSQLLERGYSILFHSNSAGGARQLLDELAPQVPDGRELRWTRDNWPAECRYLLLGNAAPPRLTSAPVFVGVFATPTPGLLVPATDVTTVLPPSSWTTEHRLCHGGRWVKAAHLGTIMHALEGKKDHEVGPVTNEQVERAWERAHAMGWRLRG